jgi:hypothetical protein
MIELEGNAGSLSELLNLIRIENYLACQGVEVEDYGKMAIEECFIEIYSNKI